MSKKEKKYKKRINAAKEGTTATRKRIEVAKENKEEPIKRGQKEFETLNFKNIVCLPAYKKKLVVGERNQKDIQDLIKANHVPKAYEQYYNSIFY